MRRHAAVGGVRRSARPGGKKGGDSPPEQFISVKVVPAAGATTPGLFIAFGDSTLVASTTANIKL